MESLPELARNPPDGVSVGLGENDNIFNWELMIIGPPDTLFEGGFFSAKLDFPSDFPNSPPVMTFITPMWHPNGEIKLSQLLMRWHNIIIFSFSRRKSLHINFTSRGRGQI